ncbi:TPA: hypothetical protein HA371_00560 [Candidatus Woesearchaeota archaeon]|nr:hypothetical protein [Candidatus Woesearchaeota archaeon]HIJ01692.1 hypothetical protein [Candidatus Woesearchaeota archaeon]HIJ13212.1 hypothetical protein [Candidatus Woesearchaeota archaeon]
MRFAKTELLVLKNLGKSINEIIVDVGKSKSQVYRAVSSLKKKDAIGEGKTLLPKHSHILLLVNILKKNSRLVNILNDSAIDFLVCLDKPRAVSEVSGLIGVKNITLYKIIEKLRRFNILRKENSKYSINPLFNEFVELTESMHTYSMNVDERIPLGSRIYLKNQKEILFSNKSILDASITAFSRYNDFGITVITKDTYYYMPKKVLGIKEIFIHSLYVAEKEKSSIILVALFYLRNKRKLSGIRHFVLDSLRKIFNGERIPDYPVLEELLMKAREYDINIRDIKETFQ